jgi:TonB-linked SusC/RagA family outer membrane protein
MTIKKMFNYLRPMLLLLLWLICPGALFSQERVISGSVKGPDGAGLANVTVLVKNTTTGTITNAEGKYSLSVGNDAVLLFSFIGCQTQEVAVGSQSLIDVALKEEVQQIGEVIITSLGIERSVKALQSSVTKVPGVSLTSARENNFGASIQGKVAGVDVSRPQTGPAGSSRVIIRGNKSLGGDNQPLYVVDGIPIDNTNWGQSGFWGGPDYGDGLTSINPDDIESLSVLKGATAAALYGSRGGYGVINITTKKGQARKGIGIEFNSNYVFEKVINYLDLQTEYGQGGLANSDPNDPSSPRVGSNPATQDQAFLWGTSSWGAKMDGVSTIMWDGNIRPYSLTGVPHNYNSFFQTGNSFTNTLSLSGGSEKHTYRFSFSDLRSTGVIPNSGFNRKNVSFSTDGKFGKKVTFNAKILYSNEETKNRPMVSDSPGNAVQALMILPPNYDVNYMVGDPAKLGAVPEGVTTVDGKSPGYEYQLSDNLWNQNPWWAAYQFINSDTRDRLITSGTLRYDITSFLYLQGRIGMDLSVRKTKTLVPQGTGYWIGGGDSEGETQVREINQEWTFGLDKAFGKVNINTFVGGNKMVHKTEHVGASGNDFNVPFFTSVNNTSRQFIEYWYEAYGINSLFGSAEVSYDGYLYLTATARNDWFSVLNPENNSKLYPSIGASFVFTDAFKNLPEAISFGKLRASWGQVATANVFPYWTNMAYTVDGVGHLGIPMAGYATYDNIPNPKLSPALSTELELGIELRLFKGRVGIDFAYYDQKTTNDILMAGISGTSGFSSTSINIGQLSNKGIEILLTAKPVQAVINWEVSLNLAKNKNKVLALTPDINELTLYSWYQPRTATVLVKHIVGYPFGMLTGAVQKTDYAGHRFYTAEGEPVQSQSYEILGNGVADLTGGVNNSFTYKQFNLSFLIDFKAGGDIYSGTNVRLLEDGLTKESLTGRDGTMEITGHFEDGIHPDGSTKYTNVTTRMLTAEQAQNYWQALGERDEAHFVYDASFVKLRQLTFGYDFPASLLSKTPIKTLNLSFVGRNVLCLYKNTPNIDPEASYSNSPSQGLDYFGLPSTRSYGFNLKVIF